MYLKVKTLPVMAVFLLIAVERGPVPPVDCADVPFQPVPQVRYVRAPVQVGGEVPERHSEPGEHHHGDWQRGAEERAVLE